MHSTKPDGRAERDPYFDWLLHGMLKWNHTRRKFGQERKRRARSSEALHKTRSSHRDTAVASRFLSAHGLVGTLYFYLPVTPPPIRPSAHKIASIPKEIPCDPTKNDDEFSKFG
jgi:hypothetical protein